jgi:hypothetical protein
VQDAALGLSGENTIADADLPIELLKDIRGILRDHEAAIVDGVIKTDTVLEYLHDMADRPWPAFGRTEKPLTSHKLSQLLKRFGIVSAGRLRVDGARARGYRADAFDEAFARYLGSDQPSQEEAF